MPKHYVLIFPHIFTERDWRRFGCEEMKKLGYQITIIQFSKLLQYDTDKLSRGDFKSHPEAKTPKNFDEVGKLLDGLSYQDIIRLFVPVTSNVWIYEAIKERKLRYVHSSLGNVPNSFLPNFSGSINLFEYVYYQINCVKALSERIFHRLFFIIKIGMTYWRLPPPYVWMRAGFVNPHNVNAAPHKWRAKILDVASSDVELIQFKTNKPTNFANTAFAVFIDSGLTNHPDYEILNAIPPVSEAAYYPALCKVFDKIEKDLSCEVIIAAHPKTTYTNQKNKNIFGGRKIITDKTAELIKQSILTLSHFSTALSYVSLYRKPIIFLTSNEIEALPNSKWFKKDIICGSSWFGQKRLNIDHVSSVSSEFKIPHVDETLYKKYEDSFLRSPTSKGEASWELLANIYERPSDHSTYR